MKHLNAPAAALFMRCVGVYRALHRLMTIKRASSWRQCRTASPGEQVQGARSRLSMTGFLQPGSSIISRVGFWRAPDICRQGWVLKSACRLNLPEDPASINQGPESGRSSSPPASSGTGFFLTMPTISDNGISPVANTAAQ